MKSFFRNTLLIMLSVIFMIPYVAFAGDIDGAREIRLTDTIPFEFRYNDENDMGKVAAAYYFIPQTTDYYDISLGNIADGDTYLGVFDDSGKRLVFKNNLNNSSCNSIIKLDANRKYFFVAFYCDEQANSNKDFNAQAYITRAKYPSQPEDAKCGKGTGTKIGFSRPYKAGLLKDASSVDIYINYNEALGENEFTLFIGPDCNTKSKTETVKVSKAGWYNLDLSDVSLNDIAKDERVFVGFESNNKTAANQLVTCSATCVSDYFADDKLYSRTAKGSWLNQNASVYNGFCAVFYYDKIEFRLSASGDKTPEEVEEEKPLRALFISDIHYNNDFAGDPPAAGDKNDLGRGTRGDERMQIMVDAINAEHHKKPIDFVIINGDLRSITVKNREQKIEDLEKLRDRWLSQLEMPYYATRGNHDGYTNEDWERILGCKPQFTIETEKYNFICIDSYDYEKAPFYDSEGNHIPKFKFDGCDLYYTGMAPQMDWIKSEVARAKADNKKIWFVSHFLSHTTPEKAGEPEKVDETEFINILQNDDSVLGFIKSHAHIPVLTKSITAADSAVNDGNGYNIPKWNINTGSFGAIPLNSKGVTPDTYRFGFKIIEIVPEGLKVQQIYPAMTYPRWKTSNVDGVYDNKSFEYALGGSAIVDKPVQQEVQESPDDRRLSATITLKQHYHNIVTDKYCRATTSTDGEIKEHCTICDYQSDEIIPYINSIRFENASLSYSGKTLSPVLIVSDRTGRVLTQGVDYTVSGDVKAQEIGTYSVDVTFIGKYSGVGSQSYKIVPGAPAKLKAKQSMDSVTLSWDAVPAASEYIVYMYNPKTKKYVKKKTVKNPKVVIKKLSPGKTYKFKILAVDESGAYVSNYSKTFVTATRCKAPAIKVQSLAKGKVKVSWKKVKGATSYTVYYSTRSNGRYKKLKTTSKKAYTTKKLSSKKTYYIKVVANRKVKGCPTVKSAYSTAKRIRIK